MEIIVLTDAEIENLTLERLFPLVAAKMGYDPDETPLRYDYRELRIGNGIVERIKKTYERNMPEIPPMRAREKALTDIANYNLRTGHVPDNTILVESGFIVKGSQADLSRKEAG